ncbi:MAG TPA: GtrA family protein [Paracoccaceae bacterium]|nr:GtrA family protein [Paracoccaceae bacterium]
MTGLVLRYAAFAGIATLVNLGVQRAVLAVDRGALAFTLAMICGTAAGLVVKYILDKRWIFDDRSTGLRAHGQRFSAYAAFGLLTTAIFWGFETAFWIWGGTDGWREAGAVIGLAIGYVLKYRLDRRYVFTPAGAA